MSGFTDVRVVHSSLIPEGMVYLFPEPLLECGPLLFIEEPTEARWEAVQIVHDGLADVLDWLRAAGHHLPTWQEQQRAIEGTALMHFQADLHITLTIPRPFALGGLS